MFWFVLEQPLFVPDFLVQLIINIHFYFEKCPSRTIKLDNHSTPGSIGSAAVPVCYEHVEDPEQITEPLRDLAGQAEIWT